MKKNEGNTAPFFTAVFAFVMLLTVFFSIYLFWRQREVKDARERCRIIAGDYTSTIQTQLNRVNLVNYTIRAMVRDHQGDPEFFDEAIRSLNRDMQEWQDIQVLATMLAPGDIVEKVYPLQGNETMLGMNIRDRGIPGILPEETEQNNDTGLVSAPFVNDKGVTVVGVGIPIWIDSDREPHRWGAVVTMVDFDSLYQSFGLDELQDYSLDYSLWYQDMAGEQVMVGSSGEVMEDAVTVSFDAGMHNWIISVSPSSRSYVSGMTRIMPVFLLLVGFLMSVVTYALNVSYLMSRRRAKERAEKDQARMERAALRRMDSILWAVAEDYVCLIDVNLDTEREQQYRLNPDNEWALTRWSVSDEYPVSIVDYATQVVDKKDRDRFLQATDLDNLRRVLKEQGEFIIEYMATVGNKQRHFQGRFILNTEPAEADHMYIGIRDITDAEQIRFAEEKRLRDICEEAEAANAEKSALLGIINGLSTEYESLWTVDAEQGTLQLYRNTGESAMSEEQIGPLGGLGEYDAALLWYIEHRVAEEDRERMRRETTVERIREKLENSSTYTITYQREVSGVRNYHQMCCAGVYTEAKEGFHFVMGLRNVDSTVRLEQERVKELEIARAEAEAANQAKSTFLFNMSHDIRTPMNAILGFAERLEKHADDPELRERYVRHILTSGRYLLDLINNVLEMARIESGKAVLDEEAENLRQLCSDAAVVFGEECNRKNICLTYEIRFRHDTVMCDAVKCREILLNILSNAVKYTPEGGSIRCDAWEEDSGEANMGQYHFSVQDTGIGMSGEFLPHIFDSFSREKTVTENKVVGTGLGMGIVKELIDLMGGDIRVDSELGKGTRIEITLPLRRVEAEKLLTREDKKLDGESLDGMHILLAEDNMLNREIISEILEDLGVELTMAEDGIQCVAALEKAAPGTYDLILMDIQMPNMDGLKATSVIRSMQDPRKAAVPIVAMTANVFEEDRRRAAAAGMTGFTGKPIELDRLVSEIQRVMTANQG